MPAAVRRSEYRSENDQSGQREGPKAQVFSERPESAF
jgi:hypothetical protein